jgi:glycosyltransferase involved in cell wall biosynthesis
MLRTVGKVRKPSPLRNILNPCSFAKGDSALRQVSIVNFNAPELHQLGVYLAETGQLASCIRPYLNKGRWWERALERSPIIGPYYRSTFGRRALNSTAFNRLAVERGVLADWLAAAVVRSSWMSATRRSVVTDWLYARMRSSISEASVSYLGRSAVVVAYAGFAAPAFRWAERHAARRILNYPIAHHRYHLALRHEEAERVPSFASTWPELVGFTPQYMAELDAEIEAADAVVVGSAYCASTFTACAVKAEKLKRVPYGVDLGVFAPEPNAEVREDFRAIYVGQLSQRKGLSYLLEAYRQFAGRGTKLTLVGNPVGSMAPLKPYASLFRHLPHLPRPALAAEYCRHDVFVFPTLLEGMPLVVAEAMACGLPVITTANGPDELVRDGIDGFIVPQRDPSAIVEKLELLRADADLRRRMGENAARRAREFTWAAYCQRFQHLLDGDGAYEK